MQDDLTQGRSDEQMQKNAEVVGLLAIAALVIFVLSCALALWRLVSGT